MKRVLTLAAVIAGITLLALTVRSGAAQAATSWQTSAPRQAIATYDTATLGLRNKYGDPGECYRFVVEVYDPYGDRVGRTSDWVCGDSWTYLDFVATQTPGVYTVYYGVGGDLIASDRFLVVW